MQYGLILRFILQSTLKLHIAACTVIVYERLTVKEVYQPTTDMQLVIASVILAALNLCPFLFCFVFVKNRKQLNEPNIIRKFGTLYNGLNAKNQQVMSYSIVYLVRRSLFVAITFALFESPGVQLQLMVFMTVMYLVYLG